jgi:hypothetical protein
VTTPPWREINWSDVAHEAVALALEAHLAEDRAEGFVLTRAPLIRLCAIRLPDRTVQMVWTFHHLLIDGWSLSLILAEVLAAYHAFREGLHQPMVAATPYRRFVDWVARRDEARRLGFDTGPRRDVPVPDRRSAGPAACARGRTGRAAGDPARHRNRTCAPPARPAYTSPSRHEGRSTGMSRAVTDEQHSGAAIEGDIALIGMAWRFPGAESPDEFWRLLIDGVEAIDTLSTEELLQAGVAPP